MESNTNTDIYDTILICPICLKNIPAFSWAIRNNTIQIDVDCKDCLKSTMDLEHYLNVIKQPQGNTYCTRDSSHILNLSDKYCLDCQKWVCYDCFNTHSIEPALNSHIFISREVNIEITCPIHTGSTLKHYCTNCKQCVCEQCKEQSHVNHNTYTNHSEGPYDNPFTSKFVDSTVTAYKNKTDSLISLINSKIQNLLILKENLESSFIVYQKNNNLLKTFASIVKHNSELSKHYPIYNLDYNLNNNFEISQILPLIKYNNIENDAATLINYFKSNCVYVRKTSIKWITTIRNQSLSHITTMIQLKNSTIVTGAREGNVTFWNSTHWFPMIQSKLHSDSVNALIELNQGGVASASKDCSIIIWGSFSTLGYNKVTNAHKASVTSLLLLKDISLASGSEDQTIKIWLIKKNLFCIKEIKITNTSVTCFSSLHNGNFVSGMTDFSIRVWEGQTQTQITSMNLHKGAISCFLLLKKNKLLSGSVEGLAVIWNMITFTKIGRFEFYKEIKSITYLNDCTLLFTTVSSFYKLNIKNGREVGGHSLKKIGKSLNLNNGSVLIYIWHHFEIWKM